MKKQQLPTGRIICRHDQQTSIPTGKVGVKAGDAQFEHILCDLGKDLTDVWKWWPSSTT
ncbi:hypothetical protein NSS94_25725 [Paenibacillus sp. FSL L8-0644]|uniref:hypothetical protein n=1 Tax=Paenibacillus sp. FSL L8-0644 TaxID=2954523 RepID=UPI0030F68AC8